MTNLRARVVEAMAQAAYERFFDLSWDEASEIDRALFLAVAEAALDAALDILGGHDVNWLRVHGLVAVLRAGKGSDE